MTDFKIASEIFLYNAWYINLLNASLFTRYQATVLRLPSFAFVIQNEMWRCQENKRRCFFNSSGICY